MTTDLKTNSSPSAIWVPRRAGWTFVVMVVLLGLSKVSLAAVTRVGNGNDGRDLEGFERIESGPVAEARQVAVAKVKSLNIAGVRGLSRLIPELERTELFMAKQDVQATSEAERSSRFESDMMGRVYARTFPEPHAATRFFPISKSLDQDQLVALHIHEALHRALPEPVRENEDVVGQLTLALTAPDTSFDRVSTVAAQLIPEPSHSVVAEEGRTGGKLAIPEEATIRRPSTVRYSYRSFQKSTQSQALSYYESLHAIESHLYAFGTEENPIGLGVGLSFAKGRESTEMGPLALSARGRVWTARGFDFGWFGEAQLATVSSEELRNSAFGRDGFTVGVSARKDTSRFYVENLLGLTFGSSTKQKLKETNFEYTYKYGNLYSAKIRSGVKIARFDVGGFGELLLSEGRSISGSNFQEETGRFNILSAGPEIGLNWGALRMEVFGRYILSRSNEANYDYIGNVFGMGAGEGQVGVSLGVSL